MDDLTILREAWEQPAPAAASARAAARSRLLELASAGGASHPAGHGRRIRLPRSRPWLAAAGVLATATAVAAVTLSPAARHPGGPSAAGQAQHATTALLLARIAVAASRQPSPAVGGHQWEYVESVEKAVADPVEWFAHSTKLPAGLPAGGKLVTYHTQLWRPVSDICLGFVVRTTPSIGLGASPQTSGSSASTPGEKCPSTGDLNRPTYRLLQSLPTSPRTLLNLIYATEKGHGPDPAQEAFTTIGDLLRESIVPPRVSAALYRAAALIPGVTIVPDAVNAIGQDGVAVALAVDGAHAMRDVREEWIFDKTTLQMIGESTAANGSVTDATAIVDRAFVDRPGETPPAGG